MALTSKSIMDQLMKETGCRVEKDLAEFTVECVKFHGKETTKWWHLVYINNIINEHWSYDVNRGRYPVAKKLNFNKGGKVTINFGFIDQNGNW